MGTTSSSASASSIGSPGRKVGKGGGVRQRALAGAEERRGKVARGEEVVGEGVVVLVARDGLGRVLVLEERVEVGAVAHEELRVR